jgi:hypothetical protein
MPSPAAADSTARSVAPPTWTSNGPGGSMVSVSPACSNCAHARVKQQVARVLWAAAPVEVGGRCGSGHALHAWADRHRHHVQLEPLFIADAGVAAGGEDVDEAFVGRDLEADFRVGSQEARHDGRQDQARGADRHVQAQRAAGRVAKTIDDVQSTLDFAQDGFEACEQALAGIGGHDAARGAVQQPYAQFPFEAAHRIAQAGRAGIGGTRGVTEAAGAGDGDEGGQVSKIDFHCSFFRTTHPDYSGLSYAASRLIVKTLFNQQGE